jgi:formamidopyrimidine-DNA glycosylase
MNAWLGVVGKKGKSQTMPELPEVETVARDLAVLLADCVIEGVGHLGWPKVIQAPSIAEFEQGIAGKRVTGVARRAKWVLIHLDGANTVAVHLRMSGALLVVPAETALDGHTHLVLALAGGRQLRFRDVRKFGRVQLLGQDGLAMLDAAHGVEPLSGAFTVACLAGLLSRSGVRLKAFLLDQRLIAGLGNIYVDEALFWASLHPLRVAKSLDEGEVRALHAAIRQVLHQAIAWGGSTFRDYRNGYGEIGGNQVHFGVYRQTGKPCTRCGTAIQRILVAQRGTHFCPTCQPVPSGERTG